MNAGTHTQNEKDINNAVVRSSPESIIPSLQMMAKGKEEIRLER